MQYEFDQPSASDSKDTQSGLKMMKQWQNI